MSLPINAIPKPISRFTTSLAAKVLSTDTSLTLETATDDAGNAISGVVGLTIDNEDMVGTKSGTSVTGLLRGIDPQDGVTERTALKADHQRGAVVKITTSPFLTNVYRLLNGAEGFPNQLAYKTSGYPTAVNDYDIPTKKYVDDQVAGTPVSMNRTVVSGTAGETLVAGNLVYLKASDARWWKCDADTAATVDNINLGIAQGAGTAGGSITSGVLVYGRDTNNSGLTAGSTYYASNTAGAIGSSAGTIEVTIGQADADGYLFFSPRYNQQLTEDQQDALAGTSGTPSNSNKFVTADDVSATAAASKIVRSNGSSKIAEGYLQTTDANITDLTDGGTTTLHYHPHAAIAASRDLTTASGSVTHAHGLGVAPKWVRVSAFKNSTTAGQIAQSIGFWDGTNYSCAFSGGYVSGAWAVSEGTSSSVIAKLVLGGSTANDNQTATVSVDATNVTLAWTKNNTPSGVVPFLIECGF
jgi:hypothetical protein